MTQHNKKRTPADRQRTDNTPKQTTSRPDKHFRRKHWAVTVVVAFVTAIVGTIATNAIQDAREYWRQTATVEQFLSALTHPSIGRVQAAQTYTSLSRGSANEYATIYARLLIAEYQRTGTPLGQSLDNPEGTFRTHSIGESGRDMLGNSTLTPEELGIDHAQDADMLPATGFKVCYPDVPSLPSGCHIFSHFQFDTDGRIEDFFINNIPVASLVIRGAWSDRDADNISYGGTPHLHAYHTGGIVMPNVQSAHVSVLLSNATSNDQEFDHIAIDMADPDRQQIQNRDGQAIDGNFTLPQTIQRGDSKYAAIELSSHGSGYVEICSRRGYQNPVRSERGCDWLNLHHRSF